MSTMHEEEARRREAMPSASGLSGAAGREGSVQGLLRRSYQAGHEAPQQAYDGELYRSVPNRHADTFLEHRFSASKNQRYNSVGQPLLYAAPSAEDAVSEAGAYRGGMSDRTMTRAQYSATPDPLTGRGGVADLFAGMYDQGLSPSALGVPKGDGPGPWWYRALGEHPYSMPEQAGKGAVDAGASAIHAPSATGAAQLDIIPQNTSAAQIRPIDRVIYDGSATPGPVEPASSARPMPEVPTGRTVGAPGMIEMPAGAAGRSTRFATEPWVVGQCPWPRIYIGASGMAKTSAEARSPSMRRQARR